MPTIIVHKGEDIGRALKRLSKIASKEGIIRSVKERRFYVKPSEVKRKAKIRAMKQNKKRKH
ncbi:30S ribosomal protein S21 [bacterium B13(2017)]|nr:30S ribosomal protein S21 [bacterium B13(2017)]